MDSSQAQPWRHRAPVTTYEAGRVWYPDIRGAPSESSESPASSRSGQHSPFASSTGTDGSQGPRPSPFQGGVAAQAALAAQVESCSDLLMRKVSLSRPDTTSFTHWALESWLDQHVSAQGGAPGQGLPLPPSSRSPPRQAGSLLAMLYSEDPPAGPSHHQQQQQQQHQAGASAPSSFVPSSPADAATGSSIWWGQPDMSAFWDVSAAGLSPVLPSAVSDPTGAAASSSSHGSGLLRPQATITSSPQALTTAAAAIAAAQAHAAWQQQQLAAAGRDGASMQLIQQHHQEHQQQLGDGLTLRVGKKQRSSCNLSGMGGGHSPLPSPHGALSPASGTYQGFAFSNPMAVAAGVGGGSGYPVSPSSMLLPSGTPLSPLGAYTPGALSPVGTPTMAAAAARGRQVPVAELPRLSVPELCGLWQHKLHKLQQLVDSHGAAVQVSQAAAAAEAQAAAAGGHWPAQQQQQRMQPGSPGPQALQATWGQPRASSSGALNTLVAPGTPPRISSSSGLAEGALTPTRKRTAAVLDLSQPPPSSPAESLQPSGDTLTAGGYHSSPGTPGCLTPTGSCSTPLGWQLSQPRTPRVSTAGSALGEAAKQLQRIQAAVTDIVSCCVVLMNAAPAKWQALLELDVASALPAPKWQLRGHWTHLLNQLCLQPTQQQRMLTLLRGVRDRHVSMAQRATSAATEDLTRRVLLEALTPLQAAALLLGAAPGVLDVWEALLLMEGRCSTSRQVTTCS